MVAGSIPATRAKKIDTIYEKIRISKVMVAKIKKFVNEVTSEMKKVSWPTKEQLRESTVVVIVVTAIITAFTFIVDEIMAVVMNAIY